MPGSSDQRAAADGRLFPSDLDSIAERIGHRWDALRGSRIFLTGGTGFVGRWMLESLLWADETYDLGTRVVLLSRDPESFGRRHPHLAQAPAVELVQGDVRTFPFPLGRFDRVLHLAAETNTALTDPEPEEYFEVIVEGTRRVLDLAERSGAESFLLVSSGAIYGSPVGLTQGLREDDPYGPAPTARSSAYGEAKRCAEMLASARAARVGFTATLARCFALVGPYLPLDSGFAIGNFIQAALGGREIVVQGDGTPRRTYMYAADMAQWLWAIALAGSSGRAYNVGSDEVVSIADLARLVAGLVAGVRVRVVGDANRVGAGSVYIPDIARARTELGLELSITLRTALQRTLDWQRLASGSIVQEALR